MSQRTCSIGALALVFGLVAGCSGADPVADSGADSGVPPTADAGEPVGMDASAPTLQIGTGERAFEVLSEGDRLAFVLGSQSSGDPMGGFHVWGGIRTEGLEPEQLQTRFIIKRPDTGEVLVDLERNVPRLVPAGGGAFEVFAIRLILSDCCLAVGAGLDIEVSATDSQGQTASSIVNVLGDTACRDVDGTNACR